MRKLLVFVSFITLPFSARLSAQEVKTVPPPKPKVVSEAPPKKPLLKRIFGKDTPAPVPAPAPTPAEKPAPKPVAETSSKPKAKTRSKAQAESKPSTSRKTASKEKKPTRSEKSAAAKKKEEAAEAEASTPAETTEEANPAGEPKDAAVAASTKGSKKTASTKPEKPAAPPVDEAEKFKTVKATALEDPAIKDLKGKADGAISESDAHAASVAYNRALFRKVREIEPSLDGYVDKLETAMMKRLSGEKNGN